MIKGIIENTYFHYIVNEDTIALVNESTGEWCVENLTNEMSESEIWVCPTKEIKDYILSICKNIQTQELCGVEKPCNDCFNLIIIDTTNICNLRCKYCSVSAESDGNRLSIDALHSGLNKIFELPNLASTLSIEFSGGEPLVNFEIIMQAVSLINTMTTECDIEIRYCIQTNAVLITNKIARFFADNNFSVGISVDGYAKWNANRIDSNGNPAYDRIIKSIELLKSMNVEFSILGVVYDPDQYDDFIHFAKQYEIKDFRLNTLTAIGRSTKEMADSNFVKKRASKYITAYIEMAKKILLKEEFKGYREANLSYFLWALLDWQPHMCFRTPCGAGRNQIHLSSKGEFYPCQDWRSIKDACLGLVSEDRSLEEMLKQSERVKKMKMSNAERYPNYCKDCTWKVRCGVCARELYTEYKDDKSKIGLCEFYCGVYDSLLAFIYKYEKEVLEYLGVTDEN